MSWTAYRVGFRLLSPVHVGWRKLGNLQQTRPYLTGRSFWGALTARLTREFVSQPSGKDYERIGEHVDKQLAFTYFYPSTLSDPDEIRLWPWPEEQWDVFAWTFLGSYASTALENGRSAEAGSLHETEFIAPYVRNDIPDKEPVPVYLVGYIFEKDIPTSDEDDVLSNWKKVLGKLQFGGERSYGWGRIHSVESREGFNEGKCFGYQVIDAGDHIQLKALETSRLLAHTIFNDTDIGNDLSGRGVPLEPFFGRETKSSVGFGTSFTKQVEICWIPGGKVNAGETFQIEAKGIWNRYP
jgi:hypothetical protein